MRARLLGRRPSPATVMAAAALFVSLGGAGYAATGGTFMLGQANSAANTSGLSSGVTTGPTLNLANTGGKPAAKFTANAGVAPFVVSNGTKVASLNADKLDGIDSSGFLRNLLPVSLSGSSVGDLFDVTNSGSGVAILGSTPNGTGAGIHGTSSSGRGVEGFSGSFQGVYGHSSANAGVVGESGSFDGVFGQAHGATTAGVSGHNDHGGFGLWGDGGSHANGTAAIHGQSSAGNAVEGFSSGNPASGVYGQDNNASSYGVAGHSDNGVAVVGDSSNGWAFQGLGNATQDLGSGGFLKAAVFINPFESDHIKQCFNSQLPASQATSGDCGFTYTREGKGYYDIDFGFQVDNRFVAVTPANPGAGTIVANIFTGTSPNAWQVQEYYSPDQTNFNKDQAVAADAAFFILIY